MPPSANSFNALYNDPATSPAEKTIEVLSFHVDLVGIYDKQKNLVKLSS